MRKTGSAADPPSTCVEIEALLAQSLGYRVLVPADGRLTMEGALLRACDVLGVQRGDAVILSVRKKEAR